MITPGIAAAQEVARDPARPAVPKWVVAATVAGNALESYDFVT